MVSAVWRSGRLRLCCRWRERVGPRKAVCFCRKGDIGAEILSPWLDTPELFLGKR